MRRDFARMTPWLVILALGCPGFAMAEDAAALATREDKPSAVVIAEQDVVAPEAPDPKAAALFRHSTYPAAWTASQKTNRPILVFVSMPQCPHCVKMMEKTYGRPEVGSLVASSFETIYADRSTHAKLVEKLNVKWYPTTILVGPNNKVLDVIEGYVEPNIFKSRLQTGLAAVVPQTQTR